MVLDPSKKKTPPNTPPGHYKSDLPFVPTNDPNQVPEEEKPKYERMIFNLAPDLVAAINDHVNNLKRDGNKEFDPIVGKFKKINLSLWARKVFQDALTKEGYQKPIERASYQMPPMPTEQTNGNKDKDQS